MTTSVSMGATVLDCKMGTAMQTASPQLVSVYDVKGNTVGMSQVPVIPLQLQ